MTGPPQKLRMLKAQYKSIGLPWAPPTGPLSPLHKVTIAAESRGAFGIPHGAAYFGFAYPAKDLDEVLSSLNLNDQRWGFLLLLGGYCYFDVALNLLALNAVTFADTLWRKTMSTMAFSSAGDVARGPPEPLWRSPRREGSSRSFSAASDTEGWLGWCPPTFVMMRAISAGPTPWWRCALIWPISKGVN